MPTVATAKVIAAMMITQVLGILATSSTGSVIASPKTVMEPEVITTTSRAKNRKFTGRPQKLPHFTMRSEGEKREKSQKFSIRVEKVQCKDSCEIGTSS